MCGIIYLKPDEMIPYNLLENCVYNNPHGFGLILRDGVNNKLEVIRRHQQGGNDPKEIFELLEENKDVERVLHVRWKTHGEDNLDNTHPFTAYYSDSRQIYFMHNGVLHDFKPKDGKIIWEGTTRHEEPGESASDSKKFNDEFLAKTLLSWHGENGKADYHDPNFHMILEKFWGNGDNKGILVSNDLPVLFINSKAWKTIKHDKGEFFASNDTYFNNLVRGPEFERRKRIKEAEEAKVRQARFQKETQERQKQGSNTWTITNLRDINFLKKVELSEDLTRILEDFDLYSNEGLATLENLTEIEIDTLVEKSPADASSLIILLTSKFAEMYKNYVKATDHLQSLQGKKDE